MIINITNNRIIKYLWYFKQYKEFKYAALRNENKHRICSKNLIYLMIFELFFN